MISDGCPSKGAVGAMAPLPAPSCTPQSHSGRTPPREEELHDALEVRGHHRQVKLDLHLGQGPVPRPDEAPEALELGDLGLDPAALAPVVPAPAGGSPAPP